MSANRYLTGATAVTDLGNFTVSGQLTLGYRGSSYQLETDVSWSDAQNIGLQLRASADGTRHADVGIFDNFSYLNRGPTRNPDASGTKLETNWGTGRTSDGDLAVAGPAATSAPGRVGAKFADTFVGPGDPATGSITSPLFVIDRDFLHFQLGGGNHSLGVEPATSVQLLVNGQPVRTATGGNSGSLQHVSWDVKDLAGQRVQFQILDDATGDWGHLMADQVMLSD